MAVPQDYLSIGPFKGVPEEHRGGAARHACEHAKAALASALRQADKIDDVAYARNAYFPSLPAVTCPEKGFVVKPLRKR